jgi:hypothetical protein
MKLKSSRTRKGFIRSTPVDKKIANRTEWRKYILYEVDQFVGIFCVRETSGYGIWYVRNLSEDDNSVEERNGKWLLNFFGPTAWNDAIEFAVATAGAEEDYRMAVRRLDQLAARAIRLQTRQSAGPDYEQKRNWPKLRPDSTSRD